jgi:hypothetical protein
LRIGVVVRVRSDVCNWVRIIDYDKMHQIDIRDIVRVHCRGDSTGKPVQGFDVIECVLKNKHNIRIHHYTSQVYNSSYWR